MICLTLTIVSLKIFTTEVQNIVTFSPFHIYIVYSDLPILSLICYFNRIQCCPIERLVSGYFTLD